MLSYLHSGAAAVQDALSTGTNLACTQATGILPLCASAVETWQRLENRQGRPVSPLAAASVRELVTTQLITVLSAGHGSRWCELALTSPDVAAHFAHILPAARFVCVHRSSAQVIEAGVEAGRWGLGGQVPPTYIMSYPGNSVAALAAYWAESTQALMAFEAAHPQVSHRIRYEDAVADPDQALAGVRESLALDQLASRHNGLPDPALLLPSGLLPPGLSPDGPGPDVPSPNGIPAGKIPPALGATLARLNAELGYLDTPDGVPTSQPG